MSIEHITNVIVRADSTTATRHTTDVEVRNMYICFVCTVKVYSIK